MMRLTFRHFKTLKKVQTFQKINQIDVTAGSQALDSLWVIGQELPSELNAKPEGQVDEEDNITYSKGEIVSRLDTNNQPMYFLAHDDVETERINLATSDKFVRLNAFVDTNVKTFDRGPRIHPIFLMMIFTMMLKRSSTLLLMLER